MSDHSDKRHHTGTKRLYLSTTDKKIAGVCGGIGEYFEIDSTVIRLAWIITTLLTGVAPGVIGYVIAAVVIPKEPIND
jgi:phage shock protein C